MPLAGARDDVSLFVGQLRRVPKFGCIVFNTGTLVRGCIRAKAGGRPDGFSFNPVGAVVSDGCISNAQFHLDNVAATGLGPR